MTEARPAGQITTFYSYKGGTGRTMLLANVAWILASSGKRVLAVDWDLEAPGLHHYFHPFLIDPRLEATDGLIDMVVEYSREAVTPDEKIGGTDWLDRAADVRRFVAGVDWKFPNGGLIHLLPAGRQNASFSVRVNTFQWTDFYERLKGGAFLELLKKKIQCDHGYDHILIDSRTGVSDSSGICTVQMPTRLVVCFGASEQSIQGCATVASSVWNQWMRLDNAGRDKEKPLSHDRRIFPILMRVEASEKIKLDATREHVREIFQTLPHFKGKDEDYWNKAEVGYWPFYAFEEILAVFGDRYRTDSSLLAACEHVAGLITDGEVSRLTPLEPAQREQVLAAYERHAVGTTAGMDRAQHPREDRPWIERPALVERGLRWFLSYNSADQALADRLKNVIERRDPTSSVFFAPNSLRAGGYWAAQLAQQVSEATAFILLVGERGLSNWQVVEYDEALDRRATSPDFPLVFVLLEGQTAPGLPFLRLLPWVVTTDPMLDKSVAQLISASADGGTTTDRWRYTAPYRGLDAMTETDSEFFFGRENETVEVIKTLAEKPGRLPLLLGSSGVGKSSLARAGVLAALMRQHWPETAEAVGVWPQAIGDSRRWCFLTFRPGAEPIRELVEVFLRMWRFDVIDPGRAARVHEWTDGLAKGDLRLSDLLDATERRLQELGKTKPPAFLLYVDQGEELYVRAEDHARRRFSQILADGLRDPRLRAMMSMRSEYFGELQSDESMFAVHTQINVAPLRESELREIVSCPAKLLSVRFESEEIVGDIARHAAEDAGALPLLSYLLNDIWSQMVRRGDGMLRLGAESIEMGEVLVRRMEAFLTSKPGSEHAIHRMFTLKLATIPETGAPTRRRASRSEFSPEEWRLVSELVDQPNRLLITATGDSGETYVEVASEAIFRRWERMRQWIAAEREFLVWRSSLELARHSWEAASSSSKSDALLMGLSLAQAQKWVAIRSSDLPNVDRDFISLSIDRETKAQRWKWRVQALNYVMMFGIIAGWLGWINQSYIAEQFRWFTVIRPYKLQLQRYVLTAATEQAIKPGDVFRECASGCPEMIVVPAGSFTMGSSANEPGRSKNEGPQHRVTIDKPFAVSKNELTFEDWDGCVANGDCDQISDNGWGRNRQPVIAVTWENARRYVGWLSRVTGRQYRLLSEAEYEYAARAGSSTAYPWGDEIGRGNANCNGCGSAWDDKQPAPAGSFATNAFGLHDVVGNVWQWVEDCYHTDYKGAPADGSAWTGTDCSKRVGRAGSWRDDPQNIRVASRGSFTPDLRVSTLGFRVARTLASK
jgi:formylglycine-generating enzyme required for sulfatase activity